MVKKLLVVAVSLISLSSFSISAFAATNKTSSSTQQTQQVQQTQQSVSDADLHTKLQALFKGKKSLNVTFSVNTSNSTNSTTGGIQPNATYNQQWSLTLYSDDTLKCYNVTKGITYTCNIDNSYVGYGYTTSGDPVGCIQGLLDKLGAGLDGDALFGTNTYNAIKQFQSNWSGVLSVDGIAGPKTFGWACYLIFGKSGQA